ncbi:winged helix-turn-helix domain-containing protein [Candidatus Pelagibacter bacterium nBUS_27]|uniref:winged helix-turn-helix domain-containing protein n=1 Tax=Candidatus Pelagibacter bacterium nBUS_27 TaxID=3374188 RepID=UPI003EC0EA95
MQNLIIYKFTQLYHILEELSLDLNFKITFADSENSLNDIIKNQNNYLIISNKKYSDIGNEFVLENTPIKIFKLVEKINIEFLKLQFNSQSHIKVNKYTIDLNSREMLINDRKLKLTEKEINTITYLSKSNKPINIDELLEKVWSYQSNIETHTVETHIYRLRKKILSTFNDNEFIISKKNGYQIK